MDMKENAMSPKFVKMACLIVLGILFCLAIPAMGTAATYWVAKTGNNANPGTEASPWLTIQKCADTMVAGDTCVVKNGRYEERVLVSTAGTESKRITFKSENRHGAVVGQSNGAFHLACGSYSPGCTDYVTIDGFKIYGVTAGGTDTRAVWSTGKYNIIENLYLENIAAYASITVTGTGSIIRNNYLYKCQFGIVISGSGHLVENNEIERLVQWFSGDADYMRFWGDNHVIRINHFHGTRINDTDDLPYDPHVDCWQSFGWGAPDTINNILFEKNIFADAHQGFMVNMTVKPLQSSGLTIRNNLFINNTTAAAMIGYVDNVLFYNNTVDAKGGAYGFGCGYESRCEVKNNIFFDAASLPYYFESERGALPIDGSSGALGKKNILYSRYKSSYASIYGSDLINMDPRFENVDEENYRLESGSPGIDAGILPVNGWLSPDDMEGHTRPQGSGIDIGAYEFGVSAPKSLVIK